MKWAVGGFSPFAVAGVGLRSDGAYWVGFRRATVPDSAPEEGGWWDGVWLAGSIIVVGRRVQGAVVPSEGLDLGWGLVVWVAHGAWVAG